MSQNHATRQGESRTAADHSLSHPELIGIDTPALRALIDARTPLTLIDVRTGVIDDGVRIPGAVALKCYGCTRKSEVIEHLAGDKRGLVVIYGGSEKFTMAARLSRQLLRAGYGNTLLYTAGLAGWLKAGLPTVRSEPACCHSKGGPDTWQETEALLGDDQAFGRFVSDNLGVNLP